MGDAIRESRDRLDAVMRVLDHCHRQAEKHRGHKVCRYGPEVMGVIQVCLEDIEREGIRPSEWLAQRTGEKA